MGEPAMAEDDTDVTPGDTPVGLGADAPAADAPATEDTTDELDRLLAEFTDATQGGAAQKPAFDPDESARQANNVLTDYVLEQREALAIDARRNELNAAQQQLMLEQHQRDLADAVQEIRSDLDERLFTNEFIQTWLDSKAGGDQRLQQLWLERGQNPRAMKAALNQLTAEFHQTFGKVSRVDEDATVDHLAVAQAVRGQGGRVPPEPPPDFGRMTDADLATWKRNNMPGY
jgi:hypothetical protein